MLGIVLVSYNTTRQTLACLASIAASTDAGALRVELIDNSSADVERAALRDGIARCALPVHLTTPGRNLGFAAACNLGIAALLADPAVDRVLLLNNDAVLLPGALAGWLAFADGHPEAGLFGARMHRRDDPARVDSLGITLYASALASNRQTLADPLLGPTGGLALYSRPLLEALRDAHGYVFDERFFCYAEDTDVALRALLLGFQPAFFDACVALHEGQASSGGAFNDFVLYHGIRNSIWTLVKDLPASIALPLSPLIVALHAGIVVRHGLRGKAGVVWRLYRDAFAGWPAMWRSRRRIRRERRAPARALWPYISPRFYERDYLRTALRELFTGTRNRQP